MVCVGIYSVLVQSISTGGDLSGAIWACMGYPVLLCFALFKTGSLSKSLFVPISLLQSVNNYGRIIIE